MDKQFSFQDKKIFYSVSGSGNPVMLIHGFGEDGTVWKNQVQHLENNYCVIVPDLPGSGKSELVDDMSMEGMAACLKGLIDQEISDNASLKNGISIIGHSMGGYITLALAEKYKELVNGFGLFHSSAFADSDEKKRGTPQRH